MVRREIARALSLDVRVLLLAGVVAMACQLILTTVLYSESGRAPLFPKDEDVFTEMLVNAAMGIVCPRNSA